MVRKEKTQGRGSPNMMKYEWPPKKGEGMKEVGTKGSETLKRDIILIIGKKPVWGSSRRLYVSKKRRDGRETRERHPANGGGKGPHKGRGKNII